MDDRRLLDEPHQDQDELRENTARIAEEFYGGFQAVERIDRPAVSMFGSARIHQDSPEYAAARATGRLFGEAGWAVITGGGPGAMEAANRGCQEGGGLSVGFGIELPHEQSMNAYLDLGLVCLRDHEDVVQVKCETKHIEACSQVCAGGRYRHAQRTRLACPLWTFSHELFAALHKRIALRPDFA